MTAPRDFEDFLNEMVLACRSVIGFVAGMTLEQYSADEKTRYAVMRGFEILGEAVRHIPDSIKQEHADIPWSLMAGMRNRIVHGYFGIDDQILFETVEIRVVHLRHSLMTTSRIGTLICQRLI